MGVAGGGAVCRWVAGSSKLGREGRAHLVKFVQPANNDIVNSGSAAPAVLRPISHSPGPALPSTQHLSLSLSLQLYLTISKTF